MAVVFVSLGELTLKHLLRARRRALLENTDGCAIYARLVPGSRITGPVIYLPAFLVLRNCLFSVNFVSNSVLPFKGDHI